MKKFILTGHSRGLGAAIGAQLLQAGHPVMGISRQAHPTLKARYPEQLIEHSVDLGQKDAVISLLEGPALKAYLADATCAVLINNAGLLSPIGMNGSLPNAGIYEAVSVNVFAALALTNLFITLTSHLPDRRVIQISSGAARSPYAGWSVYCATKAALDHYTRCLAVEAPKGLRAVSLAPGVIDTDMQAQVRATTISEFPMRPRFDQLKADNALPTADSVAEKLLRFLDHPDFGQDPCADLRQIT
jgi:NAD(P)-dependent dehydrogenase (short-subunit alcohol dehydrogenase family)